MPPLNPTARRPGTARGRSARAGKNLLRFGPMLGLRDSQDPKVSSDPRRAVVIENMYPLELDKPSTFVGRPGFDQAGSVGGAVGKRTTQLIYQFTKDDGTEYTVRIVGGQGIEVYDWGLGVWSIEVTVANLTTASITLSETAKLFALTFTNCMIVNDGVNKMWKWDGTVGAGGLTSLSNAPVIYGQPTVYYAKLVGIKASERNVIVWSEESDATIGYEMAAYNNTWALIQSAQGALYTITGTNEALYYQRADSTAAILGPVTADFKTDGTRAGIDETIGCISPGGIAYHGSRLFFLDRRARPHIIQGPSASLKDVWDDVHETLMGIDLDASLLAKATSLYDPATGLLLICVAEISQTSPSAILVYNPVLDVPVGVWRGFSFQAIAIVKNADGTPTLMHGDDTGYTYVHGLPEGSTWSDNLQSGSVAIRHVIDGCHLGVDERDEKQFSRLDVLLRADADATSIEGRYETPYGDSTALTATIEGSGDRWDLFDWDDGDWSANTVERHVAFGLAGTGRWIRPRISHEVLDEPFGFESAAVEYTPAGDSPMAF